MHFKRTSNESQTHLKRTYNALKRNSNVPQAYLRRTSNAQQTPFESALNALQTLDWYERGVFVHFVHISFQLDQAERLDRIQRKMIATIMGIR